MNTTDKGFNPAEHLMNVGTNKKPRLYLEVKWRLVWFREQCPEATIETEIVHLDLDKEVTAEVSEWNNDTGRMEKRIKHGTGMAIVKATVKMPNGAMATGTKMENNAAFGDFLEKAETGAIGRALAALGFGTQFTGDELAEGDRIVDAPVERRQAAQEELPVDPTIKAINDGLFKAAYAAKQKALKLNIIADDQGWIDLLGTLGITEISTGKDIATLNNKITELSKRVQKAS